MSDPAAEVSAESKEEKDSEEKQGSVEEKAADECRDAEEKDNMEEPRDDLISLKLEIVDWINGYRGEDGAKLQFEESISEAADQYCKDMLTNNTSNQRDSNGELPCQRYYRAGCEEFSSEQISTINAEPDEKFTDLAEEGIKEVAKRALDNLCTESPEAQSSRADILDKNHTHIGVGVRFSDSSFKLVLVLLNRYMLIKSKDEISLTGFSTVKGNILTNSLDTEEKEDGKEMICPYGAVVFHNKGIDEENAHINGEIVKTVNPWEMVWSKENNQFSFEVDNTSLDIDLSEGGYLQMCVYVQRTESSSIPYKEPVDDFSFPFDTLISACSIVHQHSPICEEQKVESNTVNLPTLAPIESILFLDDRESIPTDYEAQPSIKLSAEENDEEVSLFPQLCIRRRQESNLKEENNESKDDEEKKIEIMPEKAIVELAVAFGIEDVPAGFEVIKMVSDREKKANFNAWEPNVSLNESKEGEGKDSSEDTQVNQREETYICYRKSDDPIEIVARGIISVVLTKSQPDRDGPIRNIMIPCESIEIFERGLYLTYSTMSSQPMNRNKQGGAEDETWNDLTEGDPSKLDALQKESLESGIENSESKNVDEQEEKEKAENFEKMLNAAKEDNLILLQVNQELQKHLVPLIEKKTIQDGKEASATRQAQGNSARTSLPEQEKNYASTLKSFIESKKTKERIIIDYDNVTMELQSQLDEKEEKVKNIKETFTHFKREIAKAAENSRTGKSIPVRIITEFEKTEVSKDLEVERVRLKNINLRSQLKKLEGSLREKERLAEGLHLIDFEQLKIENQTLNEKIEERNEELHKLRKKTTTTVQVLTHIKEKLQFVQGEVVLQKQELDKLDDRVTVKRDSLTKAKHSRDAVRATNESLKQKQGFVNSDLLVKDYTKRKQDIQALERKIETLKERYLNLTPSPRASNLVRHE